MGWSFDPPCRKRDPVFEGTSVYWRPVETGNWFSGGQPKTVNTSETNLYYAQALVEGVCIRLENGDGTKAIAFA